WGVLGFDANLLHAVFRNVHSRDNSGCVVLGDADGAAVDHVIDGADDGAVNGVGGNVDARPADGNVLNGLHGVARVGRAIDRVHAGAQLDEVVNVTRHQGHAVNGV